MLDPVVVPTLYFVAVVQLILTAAVAYYAFKVTKLTGSFRAWTLIIFAFALLTVRNVISLALTLSLPADQLGTLIESVGVTTTLASQLVNIWRTSHYSLECSVLSRDSKASPSLPRKAAASSSDTEAALRFVETFQERFEGK